MMVGSQKTDSKMEVCTQEVSGGECSQKQHLWGSEGHKLDRRRGWTRMRYNRGLSQSHKQLWSCIAFHIFPKLRQGPVLHSSELTVSGYELLPGKGTWPWIRQLLSTASNSLEGLRWELLTDKPQAGGEWVPRSWREDLKTHHSVHCISPTVNLLPACYPRFIHGNMGHREVN